MLFRSAGALCREEETRAQVNQLSAQLQKLTYLLNQFKPASEKSVGVVQDKVTEDFQQRLVTQTERIDKLSQSVIESQKNVKDTAETMQTILVGMENLGENFKQLQESMDY